jgi:hypothetical protein
MTRIDARRGQAQTVGEMIRRSKKVNSKGQPAKPGESTVSRGAYEKGKRRILDQKQWAKNDAELRKKPLKKKPSKTIKKSLKTKTTKRKK